MKNGFSTKAIADLTVCIAHLEEAMAGISVNIIIQYILCITESFITNISHSFWTTK